MLSCPHLGQMWQGVGWRGSGRNLIERGRDKQDNRPKGRRGRRWRKTRRRGRNQFNVMKITSRVSSQTCRQNCFLKGMALLMLCRKTVLSVLREVKGTLYEGRYMMCPLAREEEGAKSFLGLSAKFSNKQAVCRKQLNLEIYKILKKKEKNAEVFIFRVYVMLYVPYK